eukprot:TRINITY_DN1885_c0_g2_i1.p1 TRINITY_DN1885_c0_g2~~TRINITY_DN1885_c0_g2_i1.p1  ORF type:complete len:136 (+),score=63.46 TRINITY_DN1885_c0_g2_i1:83-490(+)
MAARRLRDEKAKCQLLGIIGEAFDLPDGNTNELRAVLDTHDDADVTAFMLRKLSAEERGKAVVIDEPVVGTADLQDASSTYHTLNGTLNSTTQLTPRPPQEESWEEESVDDSPPTPPVRPHPQQPAARAGSGEVR